MANIGQLTAIVDADIKPLKREVRSANKEVKKFEKNTKKVTQSSAMNWKKLGTAVGGVAAAYAAFAGVKAVTQAFVRQEDAIAQLEARLKSTNGVVGLTSKQLQNMASGLQGVTKFGDEAIIEMQSLLLTFTEIGGETFPQATEAILNVSTAMGQDLKSSAVQVGKALNDPILGVTALARSGIQFTEVQKDMIKQLVKVGDKAGAQALILKELETQFGGAARAAKDTLGGALQSAENAAGDFAESLGKVLAPTMRELAGVVEFAAVQLREMIDPTLEGELRAIDKEIDGLSDTYRELAEAAQWHGGDMSQALFVENQINALVEDRIKLQEQLNKLREPKTFESQVPQAGEVGGVVPGVDTGLISEGGGVSQFAPGGLLGAGMPTSLSEIGEEPSFGLSMLGDPAGFLAAKEQLIPEIQSFTDTLIGNQLQVEEQITASEERMAAATKKAADDKIKAWGQVGSSLIGISGQITNTLGKNAKGLAKVLEVTGAGIALTNTFIGASEALKLPYPGNIVAALSVVSQGLSFVSAIGGGGGSGGGAASAAGIPGGLDRTGGLAQEEAGAGEKQATVIIQVDGDVVDLDEWMEKKGSEAIRAAVGRGVDFGLQIERGN